MSVVYDYLKQIHDKKETKKATPEGPSPAPKNSGSTLWIKILAGILGCLLVGVGLYFFIPIIGNATSRLQPELEKPRTAPPEIPDFNFLLEGIIYNPAKPFVIIDGKMFEAGGRIGDFEVTQITPDTVSLKNLKDNTSRTVHL
jgi:hypothetical protein